MLQQLLTLVEEEEDSIWQTDALRTLLLPCKSNALQSAVETNVRSQVRKCKESSKKIDSTQISSQFLQILMGIWIFFTSYSKKDCSFHHQRVQEIAYQETRACLASVISHLGTVQSTLCLEGNPQSLLECLPRGDISLDSNSLKTFLQ